MSFRKCFLKVFFWGFMLAVLLCQSCSLGSKKKSIVISDEHIPLLIDLYIADVALNKFQGYQRDSMRKFFRKEIIEIHEIDSLKLDSIVAEVQENFIEYSELHKRVLDSLEKRRNARKDF